MKKLSILAAMLMISVMLFAAFDPAVSDRMFYNEQNYKAEALYLEEALKSASSKDEKAEILWRTSRSVLTLTDELDKSEKDARLKGYGKAQALAEESLALKPTYNGYHWQSSAIGRIGQVNGPLNSLSKAKPMAKLIEKVLDEYNSDYTDSWYVLGILYNALPGSPVSFGNKDYAISYMRRCLETQDNVNRSNLSNYLELAEQLWDRGDSADKRAKEAEKKVKKYDKETTPTDKMKYYEAEVFRKGGAYYLKGDIKKLSDKEEARMIVQYGIDNFNSRSVKLPGDLEKVKELEAFLKEKTL